MSKSDPSLNLRVQLTEEQLGFLAYLFPNDDPEDALIKLLERARKQALRQAEKQVKVLHPGQESTDTPKKTSEKPVNHGNELVENPVGELQELCQKQQISLPRYKFDEIQNGFRCDVQAIGLHGIGEGKSKQEAKTQAAKALLTTIHSPK